MGQLKKKKKEGDDSVRHSFAPYSSVLVHHDPAPEARRFADSSVEQAMPL